MSKLAVHPVRRHVLIAALLSATLCAQDAQVLQLGGACGSPFPNLNSTLPLLTSDMTMFVTSDHPNASIALWVSPPPSWAPRSLGGDCLQWADTTGYVFTGVTGPKGEFLVTIPTVYLVGFTPGAVCYAQCFIAGTGPGSVQIDSLSGFVSNGISLVMGFDPPGPPNGVPPSSPPFCTYTRCQWGSSCSLSQLLNCTYASRFPNGLEVGDYDLSTGSCPPNGKKFTPNWCGLYALRAYLCGCGSTSGAFCADTVNSSYSSGGGTLGREVAGLTLNVRYSDTGQIGLAPGFGDLVFVKPGDSLNGLTVRQILDVANAALAGSGLPAGYSFQGLTCLVDHLNDSYLWCHQSCWAGAHLYRAQPI